MIKEVNMFQVIFICRTCENLNKHTSLNKKIEFESLTEAWEHMYNTHLTHRIELVTKERN